jgi:hypothetical protein
VRDQVSHPYKTTGKIIVLYTLKSQRFGSWLCFRPQVKGGVEEKNTYCVGPLRQS